MLARCEHITVLAVLLAISSAGCSKAEVAPPVVKAGPKGRGSGVIGLRNVKVLTSGSVDCSSPKTIATAVFKGKTDEEKVLNFWHWYRRVMWHYGGRCRDLHEALLSARGMPLCGSQRALQVMMLKAGGYRTRGCSSKLSDGKGGFYAGHSFLEVFFEKRWHVLDAMTGFYVYSRTKPRHILSHREMKADPSLVSKAIEEKRVPEMFLACARKPEIKKDHHGPPWSHYGPLAKMVEYYAQAIPNGGVGGEGKDYDGGYKPGRLNLNLRAGESITRTWDFQPVKYLAHRARKGDAPTGFHRCGLNDEFDTVNFPYWEPYLKKNVFTHRKKDGSKQTIKRCYRYFSAGRFDRTLPARELLAAARSSKGLKLDGNALVVDGGRSGVLELDTRFPYTVCGAEVTLDYSRPAKADGLDLYMLQGWGRDEKKPVKVWSAGKTGKATETAVIGKWRTPELMIDRFGMTLRLELRGAVRLRGVLVSTIFGHNMYAGPYLVPGTNKVTVTVDNPEALAKRKLVITYKYADGKGWKDEHTVRKVITKSPTVFDIHVKGPKHPKMHSVRIESR